VDPIGARVLIVEDDPALSTSLDIAMRGCGYSVAVESNAEAALKQAAAFRPDLALLDVRLPNGTEGLELGRRLRASSEMPLMFLTGADTTDDLLAGFDAGADDYLAKPFSMAELLVRIDALLRRSGRQPSTVYRVGDLVIDEPAHEVVRASERIALTPLEFQILTVFARAPGRVIGKRQLLAEVWDFEGYDENVVEVHVSALRRKLEVRGPRLIHTVRGVGYVLRA
jgi:DNA-binding response OmpR family regulator